MSDKATQAFINQIREREGYAEEIVSDESVLSEAQDIFEAFVKVQMRKDARQADTSKAENIARRLIEVADEMECDLNQMFEKKNKAYSDLTSYEKFKKNAKPYLKRVVTWGGIILVFYFAYWLLKHTESGRQVGDAMACLKSHIKRLFIEEYVSGWIAKQGGWKASISANIAPPVISIGGEIIKKVALVGLIAVGVVVVWKNRDKLREIWNIKPGLEETIIYS